LHPPRTGELPSPVQQTKSTFYPQAQRNPFHRRNVRLQSRLFTPDNQLLTVKQIIRSSGYLLAYGLPWSDFGSERFVIYDFA